MAASVVFGIASFANVPPMQMRVMQNAGNAPELAATANISAFNIANAMGGLIGGFAVDHAGIGASMVPFLAAIVPLIGLGSSPWPGAASGRTRRPGLPGRRLQTFVEAGSNARPVFTSSQTSEHSSNESRGSP